MNVTQVVPTEREVAVEALVARLRGTPPRAPFAHDVIAFADALAKRLTPHARAHPEIGALAFWLRPASLRRLAFAPRADEHRVARGVAFQVPPSNVETMFVYGLVLSLLAGNASVVRVSPQRGEVAAILCGALRETLTDESLRALRPAIAVVAYGHVDAITEALSAACDVRLVWGGDDTVAAIRRAPLAAHARDVSFGDRYSLAALSVDGWLATAETERDALAAKLFADVFFFDQQGCSSPRTLVWCGGVGGAERVASDDLWARVQAEVDRRGYTLPTSAVTAKLTTVAGAAIDAGVERVRRISNELFVAELAVLDGLPRDVEPAAGLLFEATLPRLTDLAALLGRRDQTLVVHGFPAAEIAALVQATAGRGIDRIVGLGEALAFSHRWDGMDLLHELTRAVVVSAVA